MPDDYAAHTKKLAARFEGLGTTLLATGEHEYTRYGYQQLIEAGVGLLQPDVMWMGGPTEFSRIVAQANAQGVDVVPHGCVYGYYMAMAFESINLAEFMMMSEQGDSIEPNFGSVFTNEPLPEDGYITLPDTPGFGLELNREGARLGAPHYDRKLTGQTPRNTGGGTPCDPCRASKTRGGRADASPFGRCALSAAAAFFARASVQKL